MFHELFDGQQNLPYHIFLIDAETYNNHFHPELEICFILNGQAEFHVDENVYSLYQHDFLIVNPLVLHRINSCSRGCRLLLLHIDPAAFQKYDPELMLTRFVYTNSVNNRAHSLYQTLYEGFRAILGFGIRQSPSWKLDALGETARIVSALIKHARENVSEDAPAVLNQGNRARVRDILDYLDRHWQEDFSMETLAREMHMSVSYFSRFFKSAMGVGFQKYITSLRLNRSVGYLVGGNMSIVDVAAACGFNDYKTYGRLFRESFGVSPSVYRKTQVSEQAAELPIPITSTEHILKSIPPLAGEQEDGILCLIEKEPAKLKAARIHLPYGAVVSVGNASSLLYANMRRQVLLAKERIGCRYVQFEIDPLSDGTEGYSGVYRHFYGVQSDEVLSFLWENRLTPILSLAPLAEGGKTTLADTLDFLKDFLTHYGNFPHRPPMILRLWALPELPGQPLHETPEVFFDMVQEVVRLIRQSFPDTVLIAPSTCGADDFAMFKAFCDDCQDHALLFDDYVLGAYIFYDPLNRELPPALAALSQNGTGEQTEQILKRRLETMLGCLRGAAGAKRVLVDRWPMSPYLRDYTRDTAAIAPKMLRELTPALHMCAGVICPLSDLSETQTLADPAEFHGGAGLLTRRGIPKPAFSMLQLIEMLGEDCLDTGDGYILVRSGDALQLLLYHSSAFSDAYLAGQQSLLFEEDRYNIYQEKQPCHYSVRLTMPSGAYYVEAYRIDRNHASPYDDWIAMNSPRKNLMQYADYLRGRSYPEISTDRVSVKGQLRLDYTLPVHGVLLVVITPV